jgi:drug/metabolite transporter (DMT)-like permease
MVPSLPYSTTKAQLILTLLALIFVQFLFGGLPVATKIALEYMAPLELMLVRTFFAAIIFELAGRLQSRVSNASTHQETRNERLKRHLLLFTMALCGASLNQYLLFLGIAAGSAVVAAIVVPAIPLFTVILATLSGRESFHPVKLLAAGIGIFGVVILLSHNMSAIWTDGSSTSLSSNAQAFLGVFYCVLSAILSAAFLVFSGPLVKAMGPQKMLLRCYSYGFAVSFALALFGHDSAKRISAALPLKLDTLPANFWVAIVFIVAGSTALANFLNMWAIKRVAATTVGGFVFLQTLIGVGLGVTILGEEVTARHIAASFFIALSLVILTRVAWKESRERSRASPI